jgi:hypothetical protein
MGRRRARDFKKWDSAAFSGQPAVYFVLFDSTVRRTVPDMTYPLDAAAIFRPTVKPFSF